MMHPGFHWWRARHGGADLGAWAAHWGCGPSLAERVWAERRASGERYGDFAGGAFGVRRPLRYLAFKLDLDERQVAADYAAGWATQGAPVLDARGRLVGIHVPGGHSGAPATSRAFCRSRRRSRASVSPRRVGGQC